MSSLVRKAFAYPLSAALILGSGAAVAGELIYRPINPSFGGNPLLGNHLLNKAQAQDTKKDPNAPDFGRFSEVDFFLQDLRADIINRDIDDALEPGSSGRRTVINNDRERIEFISDGSGGFVLEVLDKTSGQCTIFNVNSTGGGRVC